MQPIIDALSGSEAFVHAGAILYLIAFLFRDQILLRLFVMCGDLVYILYFYFAPETPLWGGIFWSALFIVVNTAMLFGLAADRRHFRLSADERALFSQLGDLNPGQFRALLRIVRFSVAEGRTELSREGEPLDRLHVVVSGAVSIMKSGREVARDSRTFIGEVAFLLGEPASATAIAETGSRYFSWSADALQALMRRRPEVGAALTQALNRNMARKVAEAGREPPPPRHSIPAEGKG